MSKKRKSKKPLAVSVIAILIIVALVAPIVIGFLSIIL